MKKEYHARDLRYRYGVTPEEYDAILEIQGGMCAVCSKPAGYFKKRLHLDHDHTTHQIRGLLCYGCNRLLPARKDIILVLMRLLTYVTHPPAVDAIGERYVGKKRIPK